MDMLRRLISCCIIIIIISIITTWKVSSQSRMQPLKWSQGHVVTTTSPQFLQHSTGFQCASMFKTAVLVWKCLNGNAPNYLSQLCITAASASGFLW